MPHDLDEPPLDEVIRSMAIGEIRPVEANVGQANRDDDDPMFPHIARALEINILKLMKDRTKLNLETKIMLILKEMLMLAVKTILKQKMSLKLMRMPYLESEEELMQIRSSKTFVNQVVLPLDLVLSWLTFVEVSLLFPC